MKTRDPEEDGPIEAVSEARGPLALALGDWTSNGVPWTTLARVMHGRPTEVTCRIPVLRFERQGRHPAIVTSDVVLPG